MTLRSSNAFASIARSTLINVIPGTCLLAIVTVFAYEVWHANTDLIDGRFALFMDERLSFDGVANILHPTGIKAFIYAVLDGGDQRYGRILWNALALFSFLPESIWGQTGQIVASRLFGAILMAAGVLLFSFFTLRSWSTRLTLTLAALTMPFASYYASMPKPEPMQLFLLLLFSTLYVRSNLAFGWHWILLGLAFGAKIATLPALLVFISASVLAGLAVPDEAGKRPDAALQSALTGAIGLGLAVPILLPAMLFLAAGLASVRWASQRYLMPNVVALSGYACTAVAMVALFYQTFYRWIDFTFLNTKHGADSDSITSFSWISYFFRHWLDMPFAWGVGLFTTIAVFTGVHAILALRPPFDLRRLGGLAIAGAGLAMNLAIFVGAKRLWGFYLYPGTVLMFAGVMVVVDQGLQGSRLSRLTSGAVAPALLVSSALYWVPGALQAFQTLALRTTDKEYAEQMISYKAITALLNGFDQNRTPPVRVLIHPYNFMPANTTAYTVTEFWGPYTRWDDNPEVIVLGLENTPRGKILGPASPDYQSYRLERAGYERHVVEKGQPCRAAPCYEIQTVLANGGEILLRK